MTSTEPASRDLAEVRAARAERHERADRRRRMASIVSTLVFATLIVVVFVIPAWERGRETRRFEVARAAVTALFDGDGATFDALLVDDAPSNAYDAARAVVSIADPAYITRGNVTDEAAGVVTAEGYEIVVPLTDELRVAPELVVRPYTGDDVRVVTDDNPIRRRSRAALIALFEDDRAAFDALRLDGSPDSSWNASREAVRDLDVPESWFHGWSVGNRWFVDGPITRTR